MRSLTAFASCLLVGMIVMLTLNLDLIKKENLDDRQIISKVLHRKKRATSSKPLRVYGKCGGEQYGRTGWIATPNFPGSAYPSLSSCNWTIAVYPQMVIRFDFVYMDMEEAPMQRRGSCRADYLEIREGPKESDPLVGGQRFCGYTTAFNSVYSKRNRVWVYFRSDTSEEGEGFAVRWTATNPPTDEFDCDFENVNNLCTGWEQLQTDNFDWDLNHGPTQSGRTTSTGPLKDHTKKSELGYYAYIEASGKKQGQKAIIASPPVRVRNPNGHCLRFWYHMRGSSMGTLNVYKQEVIVGLNSTSELIFNSTGDLGLPWKRAMINITYNENKLKFLFEGIRGSGYRSDMAIDDISITKEPCPTPVVKTTTTKAPTTTKKVTTRKPTTKSRTIPTTTRPTTTTEKCAGQYICSVVGNCVDYEYFCDGIQDCLNMDDEKNCEKAETTTASPLGKDWMGWGPWSSCTTTCGGGSTERARKCDNGIEDSYLGCTGSAFEAMECNTNICLKWNEWQSWSECSFTCGGGVQTRARICDGGSAGQPGCIGPSVQVNFCNEHNCPKWGEWNQWSHCQATCGKGLIKRRRICKGGQIGDDGCIGNETEIEECIKADLPPCAAWSDWTAFSDCSVTCGRGEMRRTRQCRQGDVLKTAGCTGNSTHMEHCNEQPCPVKLNWAEWGEWSPCSLSCGGGYRGRRRECMRGDKQVAGCSGRKVDSGMCNRQRCPASPCATNPCKNEGSCKPTVESDGSQSYICACKEGFHGKNCAEGPTRICYTGLSTRESMIPPKSAMLPTSCAAVDDSCMVATVGAHINGESVYVDTAQCAKAAVCEALTCDDLNKTMPNLRISSCKIVCCDEDKCNTAPLDLPVSTTTPYTVATRKPTTTQKPTTKPKPKSTTKKPKTKKPRRKTTPATPTTKPPAKITPPATGAYWSEWQSWQSCTHRCGPSGTRQRFRFCMRGAPGMPGCSPVLDMAGKEPCNTDVSCTRWREWGSWQSCSRSCGGGFQERRRTCDGGAPNSPGCMGDDVEKQDCNQDECTTTTRQTTVTTPATTATTTPTTPPQRKGPRWGDWTEWGVCSTTCGIGMALRSRECLGGKAGRRGCRGGKIEKKDCNEADCVVATTTATTPTTTSATTPLTTPTQPIKSGPHWGDWTEWEECSVTCGKGTTSRSRVCVGGRAGRRGCRGRKVESKSCEEEACEVEVEPPPKVTCLARNAKLARRKGRRCPLECSEDANCDLGRKCVCDGLCGKTCQDTSKTCLDILSSTPEGTIRSCSNGITVGSKCTYSCEYGYELIGEPDIFCQGTGKWTNQKSLPVCRATAGATSPPTLASTAAVTEEMTCKFKYAVHDSCCGKTSYNSQKARCCNGVARPAGPLMSECCNQRPYNPANLGCCAGSLFKISTQKCEDDKIVKK